MVSITKYAKSYVGFEHVSAALSQRFPMSAKGEKRKHSAPRLTPALTL